jgi:hypothetical protein
MLQTITFDKDQYVLVYYSDDDNVEQKYQVFEYTMEDKKLTPVDDIEGLRYNVLLQIKESAHQLAGFASYAEIVGALSHNREPVRRYCDEVVSLCYIINELDWFKTEY